MQLLSSVYESARVNIPLELYPARAALKPWNELEEQVGTEIASLADKVQSYVRSGDGILANLQRVTGEFNRGLRSGVLGTPPGSTPRSILKDSPEAWGREIGRRGALGNDLNVTVLKQLITVTHLLAHEFGQLEQARSNPYEFLLRNVGPQRADELGDLAFALPVLLNHERSLVEEHLRSDGYVPPAQSPAPSHQEFLRCGIAALLDPSPDSWSRVAANMTLATTPFADGTTLRSEDARAPEHAATLVCGAPIAAHTAVRRQLDRVLLARKWLGRREFPTDESEERWEQGVLWRVFQETPASRIRGSDAYLADVLASNVIHAVSQYFESMNEPGQTELQLLRTHVRPFARGFDSRVEGVIEPRAFATAARARAMSEGLRRFERGGQLIAQVSADLQDLVRTVNELHHAFRDPTGYVLEELERNGETPVAAHLLILLRKYRTLPRELFRESAEFDRHAVTQVNTLMPFDLMRSALAQVTHAVAPDLEFAHEAPSWLSGARKTLARSLMLCETSQAPADDEVVLAVRAFDREFEVLVRLMRLIVRRLHLARTLGRSRPPPGAVGAAARRSAIGVA